MFSYIPERCARCRVSCAPRLECKLHRGRGDKFRDILFALRAVEVRPEIRNAARGLGLIFLGGLLTCFLRGVEIRVVNFFFFSTVEWDHPNLLSSCVTLMRI